MAITIKKIAEISGVSRGTVDRVLNNRGKVRPETEAIVRKIAEQLGYIPNIAGKALAARKKSFVIGIVTASEGNAYFEDVMRGINQAEKELMDYGVKIMIRTMKGYDVKQQIGLIEEIKPEINALILNPINDILIAEKIDELVDKGICVITMNTDIENSKRICYIGSNYLKGGETAGGMMGILTGGKAQIGIITGSIKILGHNQRIKGFKNILRAKYPNMKIVDFGCTDDDDIRAYEITTKMLTQHNNIDAIFIVAAGVYGVCRAIMSLHLEEKITVVSFDKIPSTIEMMKTGLIKATICQQPFTQGNKSVHIAFDYLVSGIKPDKEQYIMKNEIKIQENLF